MGKTVNKKDLASRYPGRELGGFEPTHRVTVVDPRSGATVVRDYVRLGKPGEHGVAHGWVPGSDEPRYAVLSTGLWQCLDLHGRVKATEVRYVPDYVPVLEREGLLYFIRRGPDGPVKIGWSQNVDRRMAELQVANAEKLELVGTVPGKWKDEAVLHARFSHLQVSDNEWFHCSEEVLDYIQKHGR